VSTYFATLHHKNALVFALALAGSIAYGWLAAASLALGGGIQIVNLVGLERSARLVARRAADGQGAGVRMLLMLRFAAVAAAVGVVLLATPIEAIPFVVGLSTVVPAALWHGLEGSAQRQGRDA
jgi:hypothetical protein